MVRKKTGTSCDEPRLEKDGLRPILLA